MDSLKNQLEKETKESDEVKEKINKIHLKKVRALKEANDLEETQKNVIDEKIEGLSKDYENLEEKLNEMKLKCSEIHESFQGYEDRIKNNKEYIKGLKNDMDEKKSFIDPNEFLSFEEENKLENASKELDEHCRLIETLNNRISFTSIIF